MDLKLRILSAKKKIEEVPVDELGFSVFMRRMDGHERDIFQAAQYKAVEEKAAKGLGGVLALAPLIVSLSLCDQAGTLLLGSPEEASRIDGVILDRLANRALVLNGLTPESEAAIAGKAQASTGSGSSLPTERAAPSGN